jgi:hypothetical protein
MTIWMNSPKSRLWLLFGLALLSGGALIAFTITIGQGRLTGPGVFLAGSAGALGMVAYLMARTAQALVETGAAAEAREEKAATGRRRKELEREYYTLKRAIKELELDHSMGKLAEHDYTEIRTRYRERGVRILRQLDQGESYRAQIERDLKARLAAKGLSRTSAGKATEPMTAVAAPAAAAAAAAASIDQSAETPKRAAAAAAAGDPQAAGPAPRMLPEGYEPSIISEEPTQAADAFAALSGTNRRLPPASQTPTTSPVPLGYEPSIISEEPTKIARGSQAEASAEVKGQPHRDGMNFSDSATVMRAVAKLTGGTAMSPELTQQGAVPPLSGERTQQGPIPCASCGTTNDTDANFCKKCGTRLHA